MTSRCGPLHPKTLQEQKAMRKCITNINWPKANDNIKIYKLVCSFERGGKRKQNTGRNIRIKVYVKIQNAAENIYIFKLQTTPNIE